MRNKRIIISGGSGDLGKLLIPELMKEGGLVTNIDPFPLSIQGIRDVRASILERDCCNKELRGADLVIHVAAWHGLHEFTKTKSNYEFWDLNMTGTFNLLQACEDQGVKNFIFISSTSVDDSPRIYGLTKSLGEDLCKAFSERAGMRILSLRPRAFIPWWNTAVYKTFLDWASWYVNGAVHIDDVVTGVLQSIRFLFSGEISFFEILELDGKHDLTEEERALWKDQGFEVFIKRVSPHLLDKLLAIGYTPQSPPTYKNIAKAGALVGYAPQYGFMDLLDELMRQSPEFSGKPNI